MAITFILRTVIFPLSTHRTTKLVLHVLVSASLVDVLGDFSSILVLLLRGRPTVRSKLCCVPNGREGSVHYAALFSREVISEPGGELRTLL